RMLQPFVDDVDGFCDLLTRQRSLIGGLFALSFFLRDEDFPLAVLEVYVLDQLYSDLVGGGEINVYIRGAFDYVSVTSMDHTRASRGVLECSHFRLARGRSIVIYQSSDWTALSPITRSPCTAFINYISPSSFGRAYPHLTLRRRALLCGDRPASPASLFRPSWGTPAAWERGGWLSPTCPTRWCYAYKDLCPNQIRYFGDWMWLVDFFDSLDVDRWTLQVQYRVPFGTVVAWKLWSSY
ncbi:hypothetical protein C8Q80DRAFT_1072522, partial [Daedaleopsis nitida]